MTKMVRDDVTIAVPSFFRCPISLDVMKSPVILSTGVTYDRASIERWLDEGNNTCPATMQVLQSRELVPNLTLHRLIQIWSESVNYRRTEPSKSPESSSAAVTKDRVSKLVQYLAYSSDRGQVDSLEEISRFAKESEENSEFVAKIDGFQTTLRGFLLERSRRSTGLVEQVVVLFDMMLKRAENREELINSLTNRLDRESILSSLMSVMEQGKRTDSKIASVRIIEAITTDTESRLQVAETRGLSLQLLNLISPERENDQTLTETTLSCLTTISASKRVRIKLIQLQLVKTLTKLLSLANSTASSIEKSLKLLEMVSSCREGRTAICSDRACLEWVLQKAFKVSSAATEHAVVIVWSLCCMFQDRMAKEVVVNCDGLAKFLLLMQSDCSIGVKHMCGDLLKMCRDRDMCYKPCLVASYHTKTTHITPF